MSIGSKLRFEVLRRDYFRCAYCGQSARELECSESLQVDHVYPVSRGGTDDPSNLITACTTCNQGKSDRPLTARCVVEAYDADGLDFVAERIANRLRLRADAKRARAAVLQVVADHFDRAFAVADMDRPSESLVVLQEAVDAHGASSVIEAISIAAQDKHPFNLPSRDERVLHVLRALAGPAPAPFLRVVR